MKKIWTGLLASIMIMSSFAVLSVRADDLRGVGKEVQQLQEALNREMIEQLKAKSIRTPLAYSWSGVYYEDLLDAMADNGYRGPICYSKNNKIYGYEYRQRNNDGTITVQILLSRKDWEDMYDEMMPGWLARQSLRIMRTHEIKTKNHTYIVKTDGSSLLPHDHYNVGSGVSWTVITFQAAEKKSK